MLWKTLGGRCIHRSPKGIRVFDNYFFRWLTFDSNTLQTLLYKAAPHRCGLEYIQLLVLAAQETPGNTCLFGLGGGAAAHSLSRYLNPFQLSIVELDEEIIQLASQFFMVDQVSNLDIIHAEASQYAHQCQKKFQHILIDLFNADTFPDTCNQDAFFIRCREMLLPNGILAINLANKNEQRLIFERITKVFSSNTISVPVKNCANIIVFASNDKPTRLLERLKNSSKQLQSFTWDQNWGCVAEFT